MRGDVVVGQLGDHVADAVFDHDRHNRAASFPSALHNASWTAASSFRMPHDGLGTGFTFR
ncbi:hypothetical protein EAO75_05600 [Streptomyces sp. uw30]|uniref:hypothetical protein n=1 Tax=Streptomyces sp. uw30 TaxID=1828179 RepID=UPI0011CE4CEF|nr:hypothetical protein [Streptomyces sp. uw30]TXS53635.1 hypothetical protein EAO75_05600 [Streptomyces sp. uw30]